MTSHSVCVLNTSDGFRWRGHHGTRIHLKFILKLPKVQSTPSMDSLKIKYAVYLHLSVISIVYTHPFSNYLQSSNGLSPG